MTATLVWSYPTVSALVPYLAQELGLGLDAAPEEPRPEQPPTVEQSTTRAKIEELSKEDAERLLLERLASMNNENGKS